MTSRTTGTLNLEWMGTGQTDVTVGKYPYGGLFVRMPWKKGIKGEAVNAARDTNRRAEGNAPCGSTSVWRSTAEMISTSPFLIITKRGYPQPWLMASSSRPGARSVG